MIDIHTHVLPGVDDGVRSEDEAIEFARVAVADGVRTLVATPHCREGFFVNERAQVLDAVAALRTLLAVSGVALELLPGAEVHLCEDLVARVRDGRAPTLADNGKTLLLELSMSQYPVEIERVVFELRLAGLVVVFAHPERIRFFQDDVARYETLVRQGSYGQITTGSLLGQFGEPTRRFSEQLVRRRLVHVIASDSHNVRGRPPTLRAAVEAVGEMIGIDEAERMVGAVPELLLRGESPEVAPPLAPSRSRWSVSQWFRRSEET